MPQPRTFCTENVHFYAVWLDFGRGIIRSGCTSLPRWKTGSAFGIGSISAAAPPSRPRKYTLSCANAWRAILGLNQKATSPAAPGTSLISPTGKTYVETASRESYPSQVAGALGALRPVHGGAANAWRNASYRVIIGHFDPLPLHTRPTSRVMSTGQRLPGLGWLIARDTASSEQIPGTLFKSRAKRDVLSG